MRLTDDGQTVRLDLHGATVEAAMRGVEAALIASTRRGRHRLDLVHGASTTDASGRQTIKRALHAWIAGRPRAVRQAVLGESVLSISLDVTARSDPRRLTLRDVVGAAR